MFGVSVCKYTIFTLTMDTPVWSWSRASEINTIHFPGKAQLPLSRSRDDEFRGLGDLLFALTSSIETSETCVLLLPYRPFIGARRACCTSSNTLDRPFTSESSDVTRSQSQKAGLQSTMLGSSAIGLITPCSYSSSSSSYSSLLTLLPEALPPAALTPTNRSPLHSVLHFGHALFPL